MTDTYLLIKGKQEGPYDEDQVRQLYAKGEIPGDLLVWQEGLSGWVPMSSIIEIGSPSLAPTPSLLPPPPILSERTRWCLHLAILCCPFFLSIFSVHLIAFPQNIFQLAVYVSLKFLIWGAVFVAAFRVSGISARQLCLATSLPLQVIWYGFLWFLALRFLSVLIFSAELKCIDPQWLWAAEEKMFSVTHAQNIARHPTFSVVVHVIISLIAGFSEELWRVGMLRGLAGIFPQLKGNGLGIFGSILVVSLVFGLGHLYQGWIGVGDNILVGFFLGLILVYRRSYWEAAIAHVLFDAFGFLTITVLMLNPQFLNAGIVHSAARGDLPEVEHWVNLGGDIKGTYDLTGITALEAAARQSHPEMMHYLLRMGAHPDVKDSGGRTPLIVATEANQLENIKLLVSKGANLNWRDGRGFTALRTAVQNHRLEAARLLIDSGADLNLVDSEGMTPLEAAQKLGYSDMIALLQQHGGK